MRKFGVAKLVETSVTNNSSFQNYPHWDDHTRRITELPGLKTFTVLNNSSHFKAMAVF